MMGFDRKVGAFFDGKQLFIMIIYYKAY